MIIVKFPKVRSTQFELVTNCHRLTLKLVRGLKKVYFFCVFLIFRIYSSLERKDTKIFAFIQINDEKVAIFWYKVYGVKCKSAV